MTEESNTQDNQESPGSATGGAEQSPGTGEERVFTQDELNRINKRTKEQAEQRAVNGLLETLGLESVDDLQAAIKAKQELENANKSELEKAMEAQRKAEQRAEAAVKAANDKLIKAALMAEAGKLGVSHPQDAHLLADMSKIELDDTGEVIGASEVVKELVESGRLVTTGKPKPPNLDNGAGGGDRQSDKAAKLTQEEIAIANKMGVSLEDYAKQKL